MSLHPVRTRPQSARARRLAGLVLAAGLLGGAGAGVALAAPALAQAPQEQAPARVYTPAPDTIVAVEGDAGNGFGIHHYDGTVLYPPTGSEARAECNEYDSVWARTRCRTEVRTWYRDLAALQRSLEWARYEY